MAWLEAGCESLPVSAGVVVGSGCLPLSSCFFLGQPANGSTAKQTIKNFFISTSPWGTSAMVAPMSSLQSLLLHHIEISQRRKGLQSGSAQKWLKLASQNRRSISMLDPEEVITHERRSRFAHLLPGWFFSVIG
jgi:hypothetical protein